VIPLNVPFLSALEKVTTMRYTNRRLLYFSYFTLLQLKHHRSLNYVCYSAKRYLGGRAGSHTVRKLITGAYQLLEWLTVVKQLTSYSMHVRVCVCVCVCVCFQRYGDYDGQFSGARPLLNLSSSSLLSSSSSSCCCCCCWSWWYWTSWVPSGTSPSKDLSSSSSPLLSSDTV